MAAHDKHHHDDQRTRGTMGSWCSICAQRAPLLVAQRQQLAQQRGGTCLSPASQGASTP